MSAMSIKIPRKKHIKRWEKASDKRYYLRSCEENIKNIKLRHFSKNPKACLEWRDTAISILEEADRNMWRDVEV